MTNFAAICDVNGRKKAASRIGDAASGISLLWNINYRWML
jgi:hypothetical protein